MTDYTIKSGATWPPLPITLTEVCEQDDPEGYPNPKVSGQQIKRIDLSSAVSVHLTAVLASPETTFDGSCVNVQVIDGDGDLGTVPNEDPGLGVPSNQGKLRYVWAVDDTQTPGSPYVLEISVLWDSEATPPSIEKFPNQQSANLTLSVDPALD